MNVNINNIRTVIKKITDGQKHPNLLAYVTLIFEGESDGYFSISGFTLWKSKFGGYNLGVPCKPGFKYCLIEKLLRQKIEQEAIKQYEYEGIPVIEEK